jgi:hypothetical protein
MEKFLLNLIKKITFGRRKKFFNLPIEIINSTLRLAYKISETVGWDKITVETKECDIYFKDHYNYYLELKTPQFFSQNIGDTFTRLNKKWMDIINASKRRFIAIHIRENDFKVIEDSRIRLPKNSRPMGLLNFDSNFIPENNIYDLFERLIEKAASQIEDIEGGKRIAVIDTGYSHISIDRASFTIKKIILDTDIMERIDGISVFYYNQFEFGKNPVPFTLAPTFLKEDQNVSKVFDHHRYDVYQGNLMVLTSNLIPPNMDLTKQSKGSFSLDGVSKKYLYETIEKIVQFDSDEKMRDLKRNFTIFT